tara:strand:- start:5668 stop:5928 length:261 start_codon:yes stop_codon:yes gene_type:complete
MKLSLNKRTGLALLGVFIILVIIGTLTKAKKYEPLVITSPELEVIEPFTSRLTVDLPALEALPELTGNPIMAADELPHLTLPPLEG